MWLNRLPSDYRRRHYTNLAIVAAVVLFFGNVWRLGPKNGTSAVMWFFGVCIAAGFLAPVVSLIRAKPRPGRGAFVLCAAYVAALVCVVVGLSVKLPILGLAVLVGIVLFWIILIRYRAIVLPALFNRDENIGKRFRIVREAQREARREQADALELGEKNR